MNRMQGETVLGYRGRRYLKVTSLLMVLALATYVLTRPAGGDAYGGTWLGYVLGIAATLIVFVLMGYGVMRRRITGDPERRRFDQSASEEFRSIERRKRSARASRLTGATLQGWLSAHFYLGILLLVLATLHTGFHFGWNVHTLSYVLMMLVVAIGLYGLKVYMEYPALITLNMGEDRLDDLLLKIVELDELAAAHAPDLSDELHGLVLKACQETRIGGNLFQQLSGEQRDCPTRYVVQQLPALIGQYSRNDQAEVMRDLYSILLRKEKLVRRARTDIMLKARMGGWLFLHAPLGIALLAALTAHIVSVLFYW